ncbi:MAG: hypothetical protein LBS85_00750, partial [Clostridiales Family XIII bacterium]|nr:hypothetical protein [Clostridiales Family XIII bacterium]
GAKALRREKRIAGKPGGLFSVFSYAERTSGVFVEGAKYPLKDAVLTQSYPIGVHNEFTAEPFVSIRAGFGRLLIVVEK